MTGGGWGWVMGPVGLVVMVAFWALLIWGGVTLARQATGRETGRAEDVLAHRLAVGEIDADEYRQRLDVLRPDPERAPWRWRGAR